MWGFKHCKSFKRGFCYRSFSSTVGENPTVRFEPVTIYMCGHETMTLVFCNWLGLGNSGSKTLPIVISFSAPQSHENKFVALSWVVNVRCPLGVRWVQEARGWQIDSLTRLETRLFCGSVTRSSSQQQRRCVHSEGFSEQREEGRGRGLCWVAGLEEGGCVGEGEGGHWMWKPVWLISNRVAGGGAALLSCSQLRLLVRSSSGPQPHRTMRALQE